jgi:hypothetical protein
VETGGLGGIDVGARGVADHPGAGGEQVVGAKDFAVGGDIFFEDDLGLVKARGKAGAVELAELFVGRAFGDEDQLVPGVEQGKCVFDTRHQIYRMMKEFLLLLANPWFQVRDAVGTGDFVERLTIGAAAVAGDFDVALLGFPKELVYARYAVAVPAKRGYKRRSDALEVDVVFPERVVGVDQKGSRFTVHGSGFRLRIVPFQVLNKCTNLGPRQPGLFVQVVEDGLREVALIHRDVEFTLHFGTGAFGIPQESDEFGVAAGVEPFGDVVHD